MSDSTLAGLSAISTAAIAGTELLYTDDGASDLKMTTAQVRDWLKTQFTDTFEFVCDGGGSALAAKTYGFIEIPYSCGITEWTLLGDASGSVVVDLYRCTYANFAPGTHPVSGDKITASVPPTISSAFKGQSSTLTGWSGIHGNSPLLQGDVLAFVVTGSPATITRVTVSLRVTRE